MIVDVKVPVLAESIAEAVVLDWKKREGEAVSQGESLVELETDKVVLDVPAPESGLLSGIRKHKGESASSEEIIASIDTEYSAVEPDLKSAPPQVIPVAADDKPPMGPAARRLAAEHDLQPAAIHGSGRNGRILTSDVEQHIAQRSTRTERPRPPASTPSLPTVDGECREPMSRIRATVAERLLAAQRNAAILTTFNEVDMAPIVELRKRHRDEFERVHGVKLGFMSFFAKASVQALQRFPRVNAFIDGRDIVYHEQCHIGIAVGSERGLLVPVLRDAAAQSFADIERNIADFGRRAEDGSIDPDELTGGTFTITNGGAFGSMLSTPILNPPQSAILGMHKIQDRPVAVDGQVVIRPVMYLALSYDHRMIDGREAVQFLVSIKQALEDPARLLLF